MLRALFYLVPLDLITLVLFVEEHKLCDLCNSILLCCLSNG
jgi:hypothetical protein